MRAKLVEFGEIHYGEQFMAETDAATLTFMTSWMGLPLWAWLVLGVLGLYFARMPVHKLVLSILRGLHRLFHLLHRGLHRAEVELRERNHQVLLNMAALQQERALDKEFARVQNIIDQELSDYPALHRALLEQIERIDDDYRQTNEVPPTPPQWLEAIGAVAKTKAASDPAITKVLDDMHATLENACHNALLEYRAATQRRHVGLRRMLPYLRRMDSTLRGLLRSVTKLQDQSGQIDRQMEHYESVRNSADTMQRSLLSSVLGQFAVAAIVLTVAVMAGVVNFHVIDAPLTVMMPTDALVLGLSAHAFAAIALTVLQVMAGVALLESLRVTRLFPMLGAMEERWRKRFTATAGVLVGLIILGQALLAQSAGQLAQTPMLTAEGSLEVATEPTLLPTARVILAMVLPIALGLVAIPLESFIKSGRVVLGHLMVLSLHILLLLTQALMQLLGLVAIAVLRVYDVVIFLPLWVEHRWREARGEGKKPEAAAEAIKSLPHHSGTAAATSDEGAKTKAGEK